MIEHARVQSFVDPNETHTELYLCLFIGLLNIYRRFISSFADIAASLNASLRNIQPHELDVFAWELTEAVQSLIKALTTAPILAISQKNLPYSVDTNITVYQVGSALFKPTPDEKCSPVRYWSETLNVHEFKYSVSGKECSAVVWAVATLRWYHMGIPCTLYTGRSWSRWLMNVIDPSFCLTRCRLRHAEFYFTVRYKNKPSKHSK